MPSLGFVLPHWLYWAILLVFPLVAMWFVRHSTRDAARPNLFVGYLFWLTAGFVGMHRFYLRNAWGLVFIPFFLAVLWGNASVRDARETLSRARVETEQAQRMMTRAEQAERRKASNAKALRERAEKMLAPAKEKFAAAQNTYDSANWKTRIAAIILAVMLLIDAFLLPGLVRRARESEGGLPPPLVEPVSIPPPAPATYYSGGTASALRGVDWLVARAGEFVAAWAVLAVFVYYYEVVGRYVFNSPTNWAHESMFLMFGMQYMLAGAYAYRDDTHVRVDIVYSQLSDRGKAICDIITSVFFFIFAGVLLVTSWRFAMDSFGVKEVSFTEWGIQYWPVKLTMIIGGVLLLLQGLARLMRDIAIVSGKAA